MNENAHWLCNWIMPNYTFLAIPCPIQEKWSESKESFHTCLIAGTLNPKLAIHDPSIRPRAAPPSAAQPSYSKLCQILTFTFRLLRHMEWCDGRPFHATQCSRVFTDTIIFSPLGVMERWNSQLSCCTYFTFSL